MSTENAARTALAMTPRWWTGRELVLFEAGVWHAYSPCEDRWRALSTAGRPVFAETYELQFDGHRLVKLESYLLPSDDNLIEFAVYDLDTDSWSEPSHDGMHTAIDPANVLTGEAAILWGGRDPVGEGAALRWTSSASGSVFDFALGQWRPISAEAAPAARVVTPTMYDFEDGRLAIWGGRVAKRVYDASMQEYDACDASTGVCPLLASGGIYDVATDRWQPIAEQGAPPARNMPIVEWYRDKLLVLLGQALPDRDTWTPFHDGGLYDPDSQRWTLFEGPTELDNPAQHAWVGGELWVSDTSGAEFILDPEALRWRAASAAPPDPRCTRLGAAYPVCRDAQGTSFLTLLEAPGGSWEVRELPPYLEGWGHPLEHWTGSQLIRWGGQKADPDWVPPVPNNCGGVPACDLIGAPNLPNVTGGIFTP